MKIELNQIHTDSLSCEPLIERAANGELVCTCQCGGVTEPASDNRVLVFHSKDNGITWSKGVSIYPEDGNAVYCTELTAQGDTLTAYLTVHNGRFLNWNCVVMCSHDNGYTWENCGQPPFFPQYTFMRGALRTRDGRILLPYQTYPVTKEILEDAVNKKGPDIHVGEVGIPYCESGVVIYGKNGEAPRKYSACRLDMSKNWIWSEPTIAELSDGTIVMLMRSCLSGRLYRCDSHDGGQTWGACFRTDIPNPSNKPRLIQTDDGRIALFHTPNPASDVGLWEKRTPYEMWISDDDMKTWGQKIRLTDFPGDFSYTDGFYENGQFHIVIEHNRHTVLYFHITL